MSPRKAYVRAIVVTRGRPEYLARTIEAITYQGRQPDAWHIVAVGADEPDREQLGIPEALDVELTGVKARTFGQAVSAVLESVEPEEHEWLWLLHDDSAPLPDALGELLAIPRKRRRAGVVGPAQVRWDHVQRAVNVGVTVSAVSGRRVSYSDLDDLDQGQHHTREDSLAVGLAGAIVKRSLWDKLDGTDPAYGRYGDSADFCRRAWRTGADVVLAPKARVRHAQAAMYGRSDPADTDSDHRSTYARRRAAEWYHGFAWAPAWAVPLLAVWMLVASLSRAVLRVASSDLRMVSAELRAPIVLAASMPRLAASRKRVARATGEAGVVERSLLASGIDVMRHMRARELGSYEQWQARNAPKDVQRRELSELATRRWWAFGATMLAAAAFAGLLFGTWLAPLFRGDMIAGTATGSTAVSWADMWQRTWTGWADAGLGAPALDGTWAALMLPFAALPGGLAVSIGVLLTASPLLAAASAWAAIGSLSRNLAARALGALAWASAPTLVQSVSDGRIGAVLVHLLLPLLALAMVRAVAVQARDQLDGGEVFPATRPGSPTAAAAAAFLMACVTVAAPVLLVPLALATVVVTIAARGFRRFAAAVAVPSLVLHGAALAYTWTHRGEPGWWRLLVRESGPALPSDPAANWQLLLGIAQQPPDWPGLVAAGDTALTYLPGLALLAAAFVALASGRSPVPVRIGWAIAGMGLTVAIVSHHTVALQPTVDGVAGANGWPGAGLSVMMLGFLVAVIAALRPAPKPQVGLTTRTIALREARPPSPVPAVATMLIAVALLGHLVASAWPGRPFGGDMHPADPQVLPLVAALDLATDPKTRALVLNRDEDGAIAFSVLTRDGSTAMLGYGHLDSRGRVQQPDRYDNGSIAVLDQRAAVLAGGGEGALEALRRWGIGVVVVPADDTATVDQLSRVPGLVVMAASDRGFTWRVVGSTEDTDARVTRARVEDPELGTDWLPVDSASGRVAVGPGSAFRTVVLAVPPSDSWVARFNGEELESRSERGQLVYRITQSTGLLVVEYHDSAYRRWWWAGVAALAWIALSAIPLHDRRFRRERP